MLRDKGPLDLIDEGALIKRCLQDHDQQAFGLLIEPYLTGLRRYLYISHRGDLEKAKEAEQDILLKLHTKLHSFREESKFKTWFFSLAKRTNIDILRKMGRQRRNFDASESTLTECIEDPQLTPEEQCIQEEKKQMVIDALLSLPKLYRSVLELREVEGFSVAETAAVLQVPEGTVKSRLSKGRRKLALAYETLRGGEGYNE